MHLSYNNMGKTLLNIYLFFIIILNSNLGPGKMSDQDSDLQHLFKPTELFNSFSFVRSG